MISIYSLAAFWLFAAVLSTIIANRLKISMALMEIPFSLNRKLPSVIKLEIARTLFCSNSKSFNWIIYSNRILEFKKVSLNWHFVQLQTNWRHKSVFLFCFNSGSQKISYTGRTNRIRQFYWSIGFQRNTNFSRRISSL